MPSTGPRGRRLQFPPIIRASTVHVGGQQKETNQGETSPFCSRLGRKVDFCLSWQLSKLVWGTMGNASPALNTNVSERQSPQPKPFANVRGRCAVLSVPVRCSVRPSEISYGKLRPPPKFLKLRPPSQAFKQHTLIEELSSNVNVHNALKLAQRPL